VTKPNRTIWVIAVVVIVVIVIALHLAGVVGGESH